MAGLFQVCQGTCLCSPSSEGYGKGKVLYCYGEVVLQRASLREDEEDSAEEGEVYSLQLAQLIAVAVLLCAVLFVLITIKQSLTKLQKQIKKILVVISMSPPPSKPSTLEKKQVDRPNGDCVKFDLSGREEVRDRQPVYFPGPHVDRGDSMSVVSEVT